MGDQHGQEDLVFALGKVRADYWYFLRKGASIILPDCPSSFLFGWAKVRILSLHDWDQHISGRKPDISPAPPREF
jgi:hypothetical protein